MHIQSTASTLETEVLTLLVTGVHGRKWMLGKLKKTELASGTLHPTTFVMLPFDQLIMLTYLAFDMACEFDSLCGMHATFTACHSSIQVAIRCCIVYLVRISLAISFRVYCTEGLNTPWVGEP